MAERPLSPHLSIWRWGPAMLVSILHRVSGDGLAFVGIPVLLWWLAALASGPVAYAQFTRAADNPLGYVVLVGLNWAFFNHVCSGLRHFVLDLGAGFELATNKIWSVLVLVAGVVLTAAFWAAILLR
ncbi:MAG: succinate dehydrogenase, cytochrome b556 subunit [Croceibacterium sp.]